MATCTYCHEPAGMFRSTHAECEERHAQTLAKLRRLFAKSLASTMPAEAFSDGLRQIAARQRIGEAELHSLIMNGFADMLDAAFGDHLITVEEETRILALRDAFGLSGEFLRAGLQGRLVKGAILRDLKLGERRHRVTVDGRMPFVFQKWEELVWVFQGVNYHEAKARVQHVGRSSGASVRVTRGVYVRIGASNGERVTTQSIELADHGLLAITTGHLYFGGAFKTFRIQLGKLVAVEQMADGIAVTKESLNARPQFFAVDDPWFAANLIAQLQ